MIMSWENKSSLTLPNPDRETVSALLRSHSIITEYPARKIFLKPGDILNEVYYIAEGRTRHYMVASDGTEKILYILASGWFFGETPCDLHEPTGLYSETEVPTTVYKIPLPAYNNLLDTNKLFRDLILNSYSRKMLIMRHEIENLTFNSCKNRLKHLFCSAADTSRLIEGGWYNMKVHYTQYEISIIVGGARVTVSKLINELCDEGFIRMLNRNAQVSARKRELFLREP